MRYNIVIFIALITSCSIYTESHHNHNNFTKNTLKYHEYTKNIRSYFEKLEYPKKEAVVGVTSIGFGTYLLGDTLKTAIDMHGEPQQNSEKGIAINSFIAIGFIAIGSYLLKQVWDNNSAQKSYAHS